MLVGLEEQFVESEPAVSKIWELEFILVFEQFGESLLVPRLISKSVESKELHF